MSATDERINPETERKHMESDLDAMLVCAYDDKRSSSKTVCRERFRLMTSSRGPARYAKIGRSFSSVPDLRKQHLPVG
jgi:hypothetical protein